MLGERIAGWLRLARPKRSLGERGEAIASDYLRKKRYRIVGTRQRSKIGEIDIVAVDGQTVVFVEVKTRRSHQAGSPLEGVTRQKQRQLTRLALAYLKRHKLLEQRARFDVVGITWNADGSEPEIQHIEHAFEAVGSGQMFS